MRGLVLRHKALSRSREVRTKTTMRCSRKDMHQSHNLRKFYSIILAVCIHCRIFAENFLCGSLSRHNPIYTISLIALVRKKTLYAISQIGLGKKTHTHTQIFRERERNGKFHQFVFCKSKQIDWKSIFNFVRNIRAPKFSWRLSSKLVTSRVIMVCPHELHMSHSVVTMQSNHHIAAISFIYELCFTYGQISPENVTPFGSKFLYLVAVAKNF